MMENNKVMSPFCDLPVASDVLVNEDLQDCVFTVIACPDNRLEKFHDVEAECVAAFGSKNWSNKDT
jgi:hypothetical protein